jgi:hypothetical protein
VVSVPEQMHDPQAELALLAACLWGKAARISARRIIVGGEFFHPVHQTLYDTMTALDRQGRDVDPVTLSAELASLGRDGLLAQPVLADVVASGYGAVAADSYATIVHEWALRRRLHSAALGLAQRALMPEEAAGALASKAVTLLTGIRDGHADTTAMPLSELMEEPDDDPTWVIPGLLEAGDRVMLTGSEGVGKSAFSRQLAIMAAAGVHPFSETLMPPIRSLIIDAENKATQVRRQSRPLLRWLHDHGAPDPTNNVLVDALYPRRINLTSDRDLSLIHQVVDAFQPHLVVLGPIYRMSSRALQTDDEAYPFLAAMDTLTERGCTLIVEAHAGHSQEGNGRTATRSLRPRGSSALLGWPEFGIGLKNVGHGYAELERWRLDREARSWPYRMKRSAGNRWVEVSPDERPGSLPEPPSGPPEAPSDQEQLWAGVGPYTGR